MIVALLVVVVASLGYELYQTRRAAATRTPIRLAVAQRGTIANAVGTGLVALLRRALPSADVELIEVPGGGGSTVRHVAAHQADLALAFNLQAFHAVKTDQFLGYRSDAITALTVAWAAPANVIVRSDSAVKTIAELKGLRVSLGLEDSSERFCSELLLSHFGVNKNDVSDQLTDIGPALEQLRQSQLDAVVTWRGVPIPDLSAAFADGRLRLISLDPASIQGLALKHPFLAAYTLPPRVYPHQDQPVVTVSSIVLLLASRSLPDDVVHQVMTAIAGHKPDLIARHPAAADIQLNKKPTIEDGLSIDLHPGAERFFASVAR